MSELLRMILPWFLFVLFLGISILLIRSIFSIKKKNKKEILDLQNQIAVEVRRASDKQKQIDDLLRFRSNDNAIIKEMDERAKILTNARSKKSVQDELSKIADPIRNIYQS